MYYRVLNEDGGYIDAKTGEPRNLYSGNEHLTPEGLNVGFDFFDSDEAAAEFFGLIKVDYNETNS